MVQGENTTVVQYELQHMVGSNHQDVKLQVRPLIAFRDYHATTHENDALNAQIETAPGLTTFWPYSDLPALHLAYDLADVDANGFWYRNFQYPIEQERGLDFTEDLFSPCALTFDLIVCLLVFFFVSSKRHD